MTDTATPSVNTVAGGQDPARSRIEPSRRRFRLPFSPWHLVLIPTSFILVVPLVWMLITSLQTHGEANKFPPDLLPENPRWQNYPDAWQAAPSGISSSTARRSPWSYWPATCWCAASPAMRSPASGSSVAAPCSSP